MANQFERTLVGPWFQIVNFFQTSANFLKQMFMLFIDASSPNDFCQNGVVQLGAVAFGVVQKGVDLLLQ